MHIDTRLRIVPAAATTVHKSTCLSTTIVRILGVEDIVDLAHEADSRPLAIGYWQLISQIHVRCGVGTKHSMLVLRIVQILLAHYVRLHRSHETCHIKGEQRRRGDSRRESNRRSTYYRVLPYPIPVVLVIIEVNILVVVENLVA